MTVPSFLRGKKRILFLPALFFLLLAPSEGADLPIIALPAATVVPMIAATPAIAAEPLPDIPVSLSIPSIGVVAPVVNVGLIEGDKLDAPKDGRITGWFELGTVPGNVGNAVIDGHLTLHRTTAIFWNLRKVVKGEFIYVRDTAGATRRFRVTHAETYDVRNAPMQEIFGTTDRRRLNLITCAGKWDRSLNHYDKRLIVYSELDESFQEGVE